MDFNILRHMCMSSRHKILIPILALNLTQMKIKKPFGYHSSFDRNMQERMDMPVFSIEDAVNQIKKNIKFEETENKTNLMIKNRNNTTSSISNHKTDEIQYQMDQFFIKHLPEDIINLKDQQFALNEHNINYT